MPNQAQSADNGGQMAVAVNDGHHHGDGKDYVQSREGGVESIYAESHRHHQARQAVDLFPLGKGPAHKEGGYEDDDSVIEAGRQHVLQQELAGRTVHAAQMGHQQKHEYFCHRGKGGQPQQQPVLDPQPFLIDAAVFTLYGFNAEGEIVAHEKHPFILAAALWFTA